MLLNWQFRFMILELKDDKKLWNIFAFRNSIGRHRFKYSARDYSLTVEAKMFKNFRIYLILEEEWSKTKKVTVCAKLLCAFLCSTGLISRMLLFVDLSCFSNKVTDKPSKILKWHRYSRHHWPRRTMMSFPGQDQSHEDGHHAPQRPTLSSRARDRSVEGCHLPI